MLAGNAEYALIPYRLALKSPWVAASATLSERRGALVRITAPGGFVGWGDCAPLPSAGPMGYSRVFSELARQVRYLAECNDPPSFASSHPEVMWAIETALLDIKARQRGIPLFHLLGQDNATGAHQYPAEIAVNAALGPLDAGCEERACQALSQGYRMGKIKVGVHPVAEELARLQALNKATGGQLRLRLDANRAWSEADAWHFLQNIIDLPIDAVEEPLDAPDLGTLKQLQLSLPYAIAIDESLQALGAEAIIAANAVQRLVIKPARLGGHEATRMLAQRAINAGMEVVLTSVVDSAVGVSATAHLAASLPKQAHVLAHGLGTSDWMLSDVAATPTIVNGRMQLAWVPGLGINPSVNATK